MNLQQIKIDPGNGSELVLTSKIVARDLEHAYAISQVLVDLEVEMTEVGDNNAM